MMIDEEHISSMQSRISLPYRFVRDERDVLLARSLGNRKRQSRLYRAFHFHYLYLSILPFLFLDRQCILQTRVLLLEAEGKKCERSELWVDRLASLEEPGWKMRMKRMG